MRYFTTARTDDQTERAIPSLGRTKRRGNSHGVVLNIQRGVDAAVILITLIPIFALLLTQDARAAAILSSPMRIIGYVKSAFEFKATAADRGTALLVSSHRDDWTSTVGTLEPRGLRVLLAGDAASGTERLRDLNYDLHLLVIDANLPGATELIRKAKKKFPNLHVLVLAGPRDLTSLASDLLEAAEL